MVRSILLSVMGLIIAGTAAGQNPAQAPRKGNGHVFGVVMDSTTKKVVEFANVAVNDPATDKPVDGAMADENGKFSITRLAPGTYNVVVSFIGLETKTIRNVSISDKNNTIDLGNVNLGPVAKLLKEVVVEGQRTLVEEKVDRTVYNAENDQTAKGGDATDVLKRVPMLSVDMDGNVSLRGSQNIKVLINNKPSTITASSVADALKQIPADQIKTVEVITSPSAKYDAEGSAGIINIITKKNTMQGFTLSADGGIGYRGTNLGLNGAYRNGKMGFSLGGFGRAGYNITGTFANSQTTRVTNPDGTMSSIENVQSANTRSNNLGGNYTLGWDYDIDKNNSLTASVRYGGRGNNSYQDHLLTQTYMNSAFTGSSLRNVNSTDQSGTLDANLNYNHLFAKPQREFNLLMLYSQNNRVNNFISSALDLQAIDSIRTKNINHSTNKEFTLQADYQTPLGEKQLLEMGAKDIMRRVSSNYDYFVADGSEGPYVPNPNPTQTGNVFNYNQNITAGYLSYSATLPKDYALKAGARYEYTTIKANFQNPTAAEENTDIPAYGVLVPSVNLSRKLKNGNMIKIAYNRRIQRPSIQFLNPNLQFSNQLSVTQGNPNLGPEFTNNYEVAYNTFIGGSSLNFSGFVRNTNNSIQSIKEPYHQSDTILTTYGNLGRENAYGTSIFAGVNVSNKFTLNGGGDVYYAVLKNNDPLPQYNASNQGWVYNVRMFGNYKLEKGWGVQFFGFYRGRQVLLQGFQGGFGVYSVSIRKDLANKKGSIGIGGDNFFTPAIKIHNTTTSPLVDSYSTNTLHNMNFKITFSYRIGKMSFDQPRRRNKMSISNDDMKEAGDNNPANVQQGGGSGQGGQGQGQNGGRRGQQGAAPAGQSAPNGQTPNGQRQQGQGQGQWQRGQGGQGQGSQGNYKGAGQKRDSIPQDSIKRDSLQRPVPADTLKVPVKK